MAFSIGRVCVVIFLHILSFAQLGESATFVHPHNKPVEHPKQFNQTVYKPLFNPHSNSTPRFLNLTHQNVNPLSKFASTLGKRAATGGEGTCAPGTPCSNGACCSNSGFCGYSPDFCGQDTCISNCDAKAPCGQYAAEGKQKCPLDVCCVS